MRTTRSTGTTRPTETARSTGTARNAHAAALLVVLGVIAVASPDPWYATDREQYQEIGRAVVQQDCSSLHCFRPLVPAVLEHLPGPSLVKWKVFAVLGNWGAAVAVAWLSLALGLSPSAALIAMWLSGIGFGSLFTLFDPYSADPLMFLLGPLLTLWLWQGRLVATGAAGAIGVFAKEFAAAPLWIWTAACLLGRRWAEAARTGVVAFAVTVVWLLLHVSMMVGINNSYGGNPSTDVAAGGYLAVWVEELGVRLALTAVFTEYGPLWVLFPIGLLCAGAELRRLTLAAIPAVIAFCYVQQPDRALWNFHFLVAPLAALVLERLSPAMRGVFFALFAVANLRLAAQLPFLPAARYALLASVAVAGVAAVLAWRARPASRYEARPPAGSLSAGFRALAGVSVVVAAICVALLADMALYRGVERERGLNRQGYRGEVLRAKSPGEIRVALVGGGTAFSADMTWEQSLGGVLQRFLGQNWRWSSYVRTSVANLSQPNDTAARTVEALRDYDDLDADIVCIITGYNDLPGIAVPPGGRRDSLLFRQTGYLPALPARLGGVPLVPSAPAPVADIAWIRAQVRRRPDPPPPAACPEMWTTYCDAVANAVEHAHAQGQHVLVASEPYVSEIHFMQQRALASWLAHRYGSNHKVQYIDLGWHVDPLDPALMVDAHTLTARGVEEYAEGLTAPLLKTIEK